MTSPIELTIDVDEDYDDDEPLDTSDPIVQQFGRVRRSKLEVPKIQPVVPQEEEPVEGACCTIKCDFLTIVKCQ